MTCAPFDLRDYFFGELNARDRDQVERHVEACNACRDELAALSATRSAILCMREEEPPRRIAFVSDKVFEPRWWQKLLASGPQLGFASAAMLAAAIVFHGMSAPSAVPVEAPAPVAQVDKKVIEAEIAKRVQVAVETAVADNDARQAERLLQVVNARLAQSDRRYEMDLKTIEHYLDQMDKRSMNVRRVAYEPPGAIQ
ncbi:MAG TPA: zf-HC2 domain-containing protein [Bryobacteraceae bacterium]|nr:zf-HC2 domain-containing protein [Bryobacteraceae bacterium]